MVGPDDAGAIAAWLGEFRSRPATYRSYRKEAERFFAWCTGKAGLRLHEIRRAQIEAYREFLRGPDAAWCGPRQCRRSEGTWRPFTGPLTPSAERYALGVVGNLFAYLCRANYLSANPFTLMIDKGPTSQARSVIKQVPSRALVSAILAVLQARAGAAAASVADRRAAFVVTWLYFTACRRHELARARFSDAFFSPGEPGETPLAWWRVTGKGGFTDDVPLDPAALRAPARYHFTVDVADPQQMIAAAGDRPLLHAARAVAEAKPARADLVYDIYKAVIATALGETAIARRFGSELANLAETGPHLLRHARTTHLLDAGVHPRHVQKLTRHASIDTLMRYDHAQARDTHRQIVGRGDLPPAAVPLGGSEIRFQG